MGVSDTDIEYAARAIRDADTVVAMTGAGVSTASGIPDFRGPDGLWQEHDPDDFHLDRFQADPEGFWADRLDLAADLFGDGVEPNAAHEALADLQQAGVLDTLVTQNVDGLHQRAGAEDVIELHGNNDRVACRGCRRRYDAGPVRERAADGELPPSCPECGGVLKPDVVLFGEQLPEHALLMSHARAEKADVFLVAGSSLSVEPAASLPGTALDRGATLVLANLEPTDYSDRATYDFRSDVTDVLPRLRDAVRSQ
ncbi:MAG: NAD-dependent deacetylase [Haloarculaceae archaeon]